MMSFVISSRSDAAGKAKVMAATQSIRQVRGGNDEIIVVNDAPSMAEAYNKAVAEARNERVCLMHDDVELRPSEYWSDAVLDALFERFNVGFLGVAGSKDVFPDGRWYVEGNRMSGALFHGQVTPPGRPAPQGAKMLPDGGHYLEWYTAYGDFGRVVVLDGVLLVTTRKVLAEIGGFDVQAYPGSWHYYDMDATLRAHLAGLHNITVPLFIRHLSVGSYNDQWLQTKELFVRKWDDRLPVVLDHGEDYTIEALRNIHVRRAA